MMNSHQIRRRRRLQTCHLQLWIAIHQQQTNPMSNAYYPNFTLSNTCKGWMIDKPADDDFPDDFFCLESTFVTSPPVPHPYFERIQFLNLFLGPILGINCFICFLLITFESSFKSLSFTSSSTNLLKILWHSFPQHS